MPAPDTLYQLLPAVYRLRDAAEGEPLRALLSVMQTELDRVHDDIEGLYDDWFIETGAEWVVPYIGDLLGVDPLHTVQSAGLYSTRAYVANTIRLRRRKGTAPVLEQLAFDVTGWRSRAVEFFERLTGTQHLNHVRLHALATASIKSAEALGRLGGPFGTETHTAEVRRIEPGRGRYNIPNIGLFLWRLQEYYTTRARVRAVADPADGRYTISPLGQDAPFFNRPQTETEVTHLAEEINVPAPLRRRAVYDDLEAHRAALISGATPYSTLR